MRGLRLINRTDWRTDDLRAICAAALRERGQKGIPIIVENSRRTYLHGSAWGRCGGTAKIKMYILRPSSPHVGDDLPRRFAKILLHEIDHTLGLCHGDMLSPWMIDTSCVDGLPLRAVSDTAKREAKARAKLKEWQQKLELARRKVLEYQQPARYFAKRREAASEKERLP